MAAYIYNLSTAQNSSPSLRPQEPPDYMSLFLPQTILGSSSPPPSSTRRHTFSARSNLGPGLFSTPGQISAPDPNNDLMNSYPAFTLLSRDSDDDDDHSEEVCEAAVEVEETTPYRSSPKRSRAAEVHNKSEKTRRSRFNEKMEALQKLVPNSNKRDQASMLEEVIEYLKHLHHRVQTLTFGNGLIQYPTSAFGSQHMYPMEMDPADSTHANPTGSVSRNHQNIPNPISRLEGRRADHNKQPLVIDFSCTGASKSSFISTYERPRSSKKVQIRQPANGDFPQTSSTGAQATSNTSDLNESTLEAYLAARAGGDHLPQNFVNHPNFSSHLDM